MSTVVVDHPAPGVARITITRPERRNALDVATRAALGGAVTAALGDSAVRVLMFAGAGGNLSSGGDIQGMESDYEGAYRRIKASHLLIRPLALAEKPVIVVAQGLVIGGAVGLIALADMVVGDSSTKVSFAFAKLGLVPDWGLMHLLPRRIGTARARRMFMTAATLDADAALAAGLLDVNAEPGQAMDVALTHAVALAQGPVAALAAIKRGLSGSAEELDRALEYEARAQAAALSGVEFREGMAAFMEKRAVKFP